MADFRAKILECHFEGMYLEVDGKEDGVAVLHEKIKAKVGKIPEGIPYFSGITVEDCRVLRSLWRFFCCNKSSTFCMARLMGLCSAKL